MKLIDTIKRKLSFNRDKALVLKYEIALLELRRNIAKFGLESIEKLYKERALSEDEYNNLTSTNILLSLDEELEKFADLRFNEEIIKAFEKKIEVKKEELQKVEKEVIKPEIKEIKEEHEKKIEVKKEVIKPETKEIKEKQDLHVEVPIKKELSNLKEQYNKYKKIIENLKERFAEGKISENIYIELKSEYEDKLNEIDAKLKIEMEDLQKEIMEVDNKIKHLENELEKLEARYAIEEISKTDYEKEKTKLENQLGEFMDKLEVLQKYVEVR